MRVKSPARERQAVQELGRSILRCANGIGLLACTSGMVIANQAPVLAQFIGSIGGLRVTSYDPQSLYARKSAQSGTSTSGGGSSTSGGSSTAETDLVLTNETITAVGVSGNTKSTLTHKGFTTDGSLILGPSTLSSSAFVLADPTATVTADPVIVNFSAYTAIVLQREARSINPSFINSFSNSLR